MDDLYDSLSKNGCVPVLNNKKQKKEQNNQVNGIHSRKSFGLLGNAYYARALFSCFIKVLQSGVAHNDVVD